jgi:D-serine deaminase-like pyridoxal phosphate-dependent protein
MEELDTPVAVVDLDRVERNLSRWQEYCDRVGLANRPHIKTHRSLELAGRQLALGAVGITCQKLGEAETMVDGGVTDVLLAYNVLGAAKLRRLAALLERATVTVTVDDQALLPGLQLAAAGRELGVLVDCDTGLGRTGVSTPERAAELARAIERFDGLRFDGYFTFPTPPGAKHFLARAAELAQPRVVSTGGTPGMWQAEELRPIVTEYRAGLYVFHDRASVAAGAATLDDVALTVRATTVSRPAPDRAILDAGSKALSSDPGPGGGYGSILEAPGAQIEQLNEEHAYVRLDGEQLELGQQVSIVPNHACVVANLFDELATADGGTLRVDARGRSR